VESRVVRCRRCPRLVEYRERIGREKRRAFREHTYWARPVPAFGDPDARLVVVGLAPAAHGGNRTGRIFTGDRSGDWLYRAMYRAGFANQPLSVSRDDGLTLRGALVTAAARCAPPDNKPTGKELDECRRYLIAELELLRAAASARKPLVVLVLGAIALGAALAALGGLGVGKPRPRPRFGHGAEYRLADDVVLLCSYHPSQQNTQTGVLTEKMLDAVFARARAILGR
jgi:uracil-DNA glycosylase family 4